ncbi:MAG: UDP-N-acetylmuramate dehydrogenase [Gammaproteobacteria bacterium]|nr:UDP-N-acetylmuramate dehydrogenase [Gammaproteobacteria bacterium]
MSLNFCNNDFSHNDLIIAGLGEQFHDRLFHDVVLQDYTTWHVGGKADLLFKPKNLADLQSFLQALYLLAPKIDIHYLGLGSNVLIRDKGLRGVVIITNSGSNHGLNELEIVTTGSHGKLIQCEAGIACAKLAKFLAKHNYPEGAFWAGIPGTVGGSLAMNAGCYGSETWEYVRRVSIIDRLGKIIEVSSADFDISYRTASLKPEVKSKLNITEYWFVRATFQLALDESISGQEAIRSLLQKRTSQQPIGQFSGGSVFRNPPGNFAAKLIDQAGLKGLTIGGAQISPKHANFIINDKTASANDIELLILQIQETVQEKFGIILEPEVRIMGEKL